MKRVTVVSAHKKYRISNADIVKTVRFVLRAEGVKAGDINIVFVTDPYIRRLNKAYLHHSCTTDVISFRLGEGKVVEGEVYVSLDTARKQAKEYHVTFTNEVKRLVIHGILHLLGYDDRRKKDRETMRCKEDAYLFQNRPSKALPVL